MRYPEHVAYVVTPAQRAAKDVRGVRSVQQRALRARYEDVLIARRLFVLFQTFDTHAPDAWRSDGLPALAPLLGDRRVHARLRQVYRALSSARVPGILRSPVDDLGWRVHMALFLRMRGTALRVS